MCGGGGDTSLHYLLMLAHHINDVTRPILKSEQATGRALR